MKTPVTLQYGNAVSGVYTGNGVDNDYSWNSTNAVTFYGGSGNESFTGNEGADTLYGYGGNDTLIGGNGADTLWGGAGSDTLTGGLGADVFQFATGDGTDTITDYTVGNDTISFTSNPLTSHTVTSDAGNVYFAFGSADTLDVQGTNVGNGSVDTIFTIKDTTSSNAYKAKVGVTNTTFAYDPSVNTYYATGNGGISVTGSSNVTVDLSSTTTTYKNINTITDTGSGNNILTGASGADTITGGSGADTLYGGLGADSLIGGVGADVFKFGVGDGLDTIGDYGNGSDSILLNGAAFSTVTFGNDGNTTGNVVLGLGSSDKLTVKLDGSVTDKVNSVYTITDSTNTTKKVKASANDATFTYSSTVDLYAATGNGALDASTATANLTVELFDTNRYRNIVKATGGLGNDVLRGSTAADVLDGGAGADTLWGGLGADSLTGGAGADTFVFGTGDGLDTITDYGKGSDVISLNGATLANVKFSFDGANEAIDLGTGDKLTVKVDSASITDTANAVYTIADSTNATKKVKAFGDNVAVSYDSAVDLYAANSATGTLNASAATANLTIELFDTNKYRNILNVTGGIGNDVLRGSAKDNTLNGGAGADTLWGAAGNDSLTGGAGADNFVFGVGDNSDTITDYGLGSDSITLNGIALSSVKLGYDAGGNATMDLGTGDKLTVKLDTSVTTGNNTIYSIVDSTNATTKAKIGNDNVIFTYDSSVNLYAANSSGNLDASTATTNLTVELFDTNKYRNFVTVTGGSGNDILRGSAKDNTLIGGAGADTLWGAAGNDTLTGGTGADLFVFGAGDGVDSITDYGTGADSINLYNAVLSNLTFGNVDTTDVIMTLGTGDKLKVKRDATVGNDQIFTIVDAANTVSKVKFGDNGATLAYNSAVTFYGANSAGSLDASLTTTNLTIELFDTNKYSQIVNVQAGAAATTLRGSSADNTLKGGAGADILWGYTGNDTLTGGAGADTFVFGAGDGVDSITDYGTGADSINLYNVALSQVTVARDGGNASFTLATGDKLYVKDGAAAASTIYSVTDASGAATKVLVDGDSKNFTYNAAVGLYVANSAGNLDATASYSDMTVELFDANKYRSFTQVTGGTGNDTLRGSKAADTLVGGAGSDSLWGYQGNDVLTGGTGADTFWFGAGDGQDTVTDYSQTDKDIIRIYSATGLTDGSLVMNRDAANVSFTVTSSNEKLYSTATSTVDTIYSVATGSTAAAKGVKIGADSGTFTYSSAVSLYAANSGFALDASAQYNAVTVELFDTSKYTGINKVTGGAGADTLRGSATADTITAGNGGATLWGYAGNDTLTGGTGKDTYWFGTGDGNDTITSRTDNNLDSVVLWTSDLSASNVTAALSGSDLVLTLGSKETLTVQGWNSSDGNKLNSFKFGSASATDTYQITGTSTLALTKK